MSDLGILLGDATEKLLARHLPEGGPARAAGDVRPALFSAVLEAGLHLALAPESAGGSNAMLAEAGRIVWRWGYDAAPLPIVELLLGARAAALVGLAPATCAVLCDGRAPELPAPGGTVLILLGDGTGAPRLAGIDPSQGRTVRALSGEPWAEPPPGGFATSTSWALSARDADALRAAGAVLTTSQIAGATARIVEIVIDHANTRQQFGRPLGKFQAVQAMIAEAASEQVVAQAVINSAVTAFDNGAPDPRLTLAAKAQAGRAATIVAAAAHQVLGAIGFTEEHVLAQYTRRLWDWRDAWGRQGACEEALGRAACADPRGLWSHLVD